MVFNCCAADLVLLGKNNDMAEERRADSANALWAEQDLSFQICLCQAAPATKQPILSSCKTAKLRRLKYLGQMCDAEPSSAQR